MIKFIIKDDQGICIPAIYINMRESASGTPAVCCGKTGVIKNDIISDTGIVGIINSTSGSPAILRNGRIIIDLVVFDNDPIAGILMTGSNPSAVCFLSVTCLGIIDCI